jgi:hypothetical protein
MEVINGTDSVGISVSDFAERRYRLLLVSLLLLVLLLRFVDIGGINLPPLPELEVSF